MYIDTGNIGNRIRRAKTNTTQKTKVMWILNAQINRGLTKYTIIINMTVRKSSLVCSEQGHTI
jgi:hypothetical protein